MFQGFSQEVEEYIDYNNGNLANITFETFIIEDFCPLEEEFTAFKGDSRYIYHQKIFNPTINSDDQSDECEAEE